MQDIIIAVFFIFIGICTIGYIKAQMDEAKIRNAKKRELQERGEW